MSNSPPSAPAAQTYAARHRSPRNHLTSLGLVVLLHALLLWAITSGLAQKVVQLTENTVEAVLLTEAAPPSPAPPPAPQPLPHIAPPPLSTTASPSAVTLPAPPPTQAAPPSTVPPPVAPALRTGATMQAGANCAKPDYPSASRRMEEEGTVTLKFLIDADGQVLQAEIEKTSGFTRLDEAARRALSKCQFRPGTVDGKPEQSWATIKYTWRLE